MTAAEAAPAADRALAARLFGYAILYPARRVGDSYEAVSADPTGEARALAAELGRHLGLGSVDGADLPAATGPVAVSIPFGRCGVDGRPLEHVRLYQMSEGAVDFLRPGGVESRPLAEGQTVLVEPGSIVRFRAWPRPGRRVLVAFQTEDRTPLLGNAAPLTPEGEAPKADAAGRLKQTSDAFARLWARVEAGAPDGRQRLEGFFGEMAVRLAGRPEVESAQRAAREGGSYVAGGSADLFDRARALVTAPVLARIEAQDGAVFRYPGMFGAVAPLFSLLTRG